jgi:hypothetical protein
MGLNGPKGTVKKNTGPVLAVQFILPAFKNLALLNNFPKIGMNTWLGANFKSWLKSASYICFASLRQTEPAANSLFQGTMKDGW